MKGMKRECRRINDMILKLFAGQLPTAGIVELEEHITRCERCRTDYIILRLVRVLIRAEEQGIIRKTRRGNRRRRKKDERQD